MTMTKGQISAAEVQRQLGHKRYQPIWEMVHKLRSVMGLRDDKHQLTGAIELDEGFFSVEPSDQSAKTQPLKRGNGSQRKAKVLVMVGSEEPGDEDKPKSGDKSRKLGYVRMKVIQDLQSNTICDAASEVVDKESEINMDDSKSHNKLEKVFPNSIKRVVEGKDAPTVLPWVHVSISRAKAMLLAVYHGVKDEYLQLYLDEFCWKLNRRYFGERTFDRLIIASVTNRPSFLHRMYSPEAQNKVLENCG